MPHVSVAVECPTDSAGTDLPTDDCSCEAGFSGTIIAAVGAPYYTGSCVGEVLVRCVDTAVFCTGKVIHMRNDRCGMSNQLTW